MLSCLRGHRVEQADGLHQILGKTWKKSLQTIYDLGNSGTFLYLVLTSRRKRPVSNPWVAKCVRRRIPPLGEKRMGEVVWPVLGKKDLRWGKDVKSSINSLFCGALSYLKSDAGSLPLAHSWLHFLHDLSMRAV